MDSPSRARGVMWALAAAWFAAGFVIPWKLAVQHGAQSHAVLVMLSTAALFNTVVMPFTQRAGSARFGRDTLLIGAALAVLTLSGNVASAAAISRISAPLLSTLQRSEVVIVALMAWAVIGERVDRRYWLGAAVAAVGLAIVYDARPRGDGGVHADGVLYGLLAATAFGAMGVLTRKYIDRIEPATVNALRLWLSVAFWFASYGAPPARSELHASWVLPAALAGAMGPGMSRLCLMYSARHVEARLTAVVGLASPVAALLLAFVFLKEWPTERELIGGAVMLCGIALPVLAALRRDVSPVVIAAPPR
jgi:drug/metabolite transporter (DMT)-like permease